MMAANMKSALRYSGLVLILAGLLCIPFPVTNPEAVTSIFPWLALSGSLLTYGAWAMGVGAVLMALSLAFRQR
jgi:hypothetical protein